MNKDAEVCGGECPEATRAGGAPQARLGEEAEEEREARTFH